MNTESISVKKNKRGKPKGKTKNKSDRLSLKTPDFEDVAKVAEKLIDEDPELLEIKSAPENIPEESKDSTWLYLNGIPIIAISRLEVLGAMGLSKRQISTFIGVHYKYFNNNKNSAVVQKIEETLERGHLKMVSNVFLSMLDAATKKPMYPSNVTAAIFILKNRAGWKDAIENKTTHQLGDTFFELSQMAEIKRARQGDHSRVYTDDKQIEEKEPDVYKPL